MSQALRFGDAGILTNYSQWLQTVLTTRGMCSEQIVEHFGFLADALESILDGADEAIDLLRQAAQALTYADEPGRTIQDEASRLVSGAVARMQREHPDWGWSSPADADWQRRDLDMLVSYMADSVHLDRVDTFAAHVQWLSGFCERHDYPPGYLVVALESLSMAVSLLDEPTAGRARSTVAAARAGLGTVR